MLTFTLEINDAMEDITLPQAWNEVPADLFPHLASIYLATDEEMNVYDKTVRAFVLLTWKHYRFIEQLLPEELYDLLPMVDWVFNKLDLDINLLPEITVGETILIGPAKGMDNLRFGEWCAADTYMMDYVATQENEFLFKMIASIYRPEGIGSQFTPGSPDYRGDRREKFNDQLIADRAALIGELERPVYQGIYLWFASCRQQIINEYKNIFPQKSGAADTDSGSVSGEWYSIYDDLRGDPKFGGPEKLEDDFLHSVLFSLEKNNKVMKALKAKYKL